MKDAIELATVDSSMELVVHLGNLDVQPTILEVADLLGVQDSDVQAALHLPANEAFVRALYGELRGVWGGVLEASLTVEMDDRWGDRVELPPPESLSHDALLDYLTLGEERGGVPLTEWLLPQRDFVLPSSPALFDQMRSMLGYGPSRRRTVEVRWIAHDASVLNDLEKLVKALESELANVAVMLRLAAPGVAALQRLRQILHMQDRHWWSENKKKKIGDEEAQARRDLLVDVARVVEATEGHVLDKTRFPQSEQDAAWALVKYLRGSSGSGRKLRILLEALAVAPWSMTTLVRNKVVRCLERAVSALARSSHADYLVREHFLDMLQAACEMPPEGIDEVFAALESAELIEMLRNDWRDTIDEARKGIKAEPAGTSPLTVVARIAKTYKGATGILTACVNERTITAILAGLYRIKSTPVNGLGVSQRLAGVFLRFMAFTCVTHRGKSPQVFLVPNVTPRDAIRLTRGATYHHVLRIFDKMPRVDRKTAAGQEKLAEFFEGVGDRVKNLRVHENFMKTTGLVGMSFLVNGIALLYAIEDESSTPLQYSLGVVAGIGGITGNVLSAVELGYLKHGFSADGKILKGLKTGSRSVSLVIGLLILTATASTAFDDRQRPASEAVVNGLSGVAAFSSTVGFGLELANAAELAAMFGVAGLVLGLVALGATIAFELLEPGPKALFEAYLDLAENNLVVAKYPIEIQAIKDVVKLAVAGHAFEDFRDFKGTKDDDPMRGSPTWHKAHKLGFTLAEIITLFDASAQAVHIRLG